MAGGKREKTTSFIMDAKYYKQIEKMSDERAGALMKAILSYNLTGKEPYFSGDEALEMIFDIMKNDFDKNAEKYEKKCNEMSDERSKAGKAGAEARWGKDIKNNEQSKNNKNSKGNKNGYGMKCNEMKCDDVICNEVSMSSVSDNYNDRKNTACNSCESNSRIISFGKDKFPTTQAEIQKIETFAKQLCSEYKQNLPSKVDMQHVFDYTYTRKELPDGQAIAAFDQQKAALLEYAFEQAALAEKVNWKYINGIYKNFVRNGIHTLEQAQAYEFQYQNGYSPEDLAQK